MGIGDWGFGIRDCGESPIPIKRLMIKIKKNNIEKI